MKILIINGSPKGRYSVTLHTCLFIQKHNPEHEYKILNAGQLIKLIEKDFESSREMLNWAELIIFSYPVYTFLVPSQLHRFIELIKENGVDLSGKFATQITTSKHFYDMTAHRFIEDNCTDLGLKYIKGLSADMEDLTKKEGRADALSFFKYVSYCVENGIYETASLKVVKDAPYTPTLINSTSESYNEDTLPPADTDTQSEVCSADKKETVIVTDLSENDSELLAMIEDFKAVYPYKTRTVNIREFPFDGGCISCFNCAKDGKCIYKDGFDAFLREQIQTASSIVYAFTVKDHSMGARFKLYDDRQFCNGHRTVTMGMSMGYIVAGGIDGEDNLKTVMEARCEVGHNFLAGIASTPTEIKRMSERMVYAVENGYVQPKNFYGVGGMKIFRDLIYIMRGIMVADHKFYKKHGVYDFPQKRRGTLIAMLLVGKLMNNKKLRKKLGGKINEGMVAPYKKVLEKY